MTTVSSFAPIEGDSPRVLILGSMPGVASLAAGQYYAHPRNAFWKIMEAVLDIPAVDGYETRVEKLKHFNIALWDVLESCIRPGSLDAAIEMDSAKANDIKALIQRHPGINVICFNGGSAEKIFKKRVLPLLGDFSVKYIRLPSTSPAHAGMPFENKVMAWRAAIQPNI
ncbi:DNA-deoxyinosine glycosylase [Methylotenera sp. G11]|uniref:DNA-deoxyinosine glycosylase n=1 Tax=Methylotenera sp. G11 TaxID=1506585 RepID=UPI00064890EB|nr:DNA-deoxyinosine glycosylase [Methylotenera sp. G11]